MKKIFRFIFTTNILFNIALSHPPSKINFDFDMDKKKVIVTVEHKVKEPTDHFIDKITLSLNGKKIIEQVSSLQINNDVQIYEYLIPELSENDKIIIWSNCNKFGSLKKEFVVKTDNVMKIDKTEKKSSEKNGCCPR
ncbi:MAG: hypothetical protein N2643_02440 [Endomicrobia bacterium]|nr:hypothetical protein [Endomicrobiia bacterium]